MPVSYQQADESVHQMAAEILEQHHNPDLRMPDGSFVRLCILLAFNDDDGEKTPAVKWHGEPADGVVSVISLKQRVDKRADAEIVLDLAKWDDLTEPQQRALLDHFIEHIVISKDENDCVICDDAGRPKIKLRQCDWNLRGFRSIARRYGQDAPEVRAAKQFEEDFGEDVLGKSNLFTGAGQ
jgi:hypothetical protein